jgi:hypothetical protein
MPDKIKRKRKKRSTKTTQSQSQKVIVNIGTTSARKRSSKPRTGGGRSSQPQVIYQPAPIPLQPNYNTQLNDLRREVKANIAQSQGQRTGNLAFNEGVQGTTVQAETQDAAELVDATGNIGNRLGRRPAEAPPAPPPLEEYEFPDAPSPIAEPVFAEAVPLRSASAPVKARKQRSDKGVSRGPSVRTVLQRFDVVVEPPSKLAAAEPTAGPIKASEPFKPRGNDVFTLGGKAYVTQKGETIAKARSRVMKEEKQTRGRALGRGGGGGGRSSSQEL